MEKRLKHVEMLNPKLSNSMDEFWEKKESIHEPS